jgi:hypothetical protein
MLYKLWLTFGLKKQWITKPFCNTHEGYLQLTDEQEKEFDEGGDPCVIVIQLIENNIG